MRISGGRNKKVTMLCYSQQSCRKECHSSGVRPPTQPYPHRDEDCPKCEQLTALVFEDDKAADFDSNGPSRVNPL